MSVNREHKGSVTPNGSEVNCRPGRARSGLLAFLRPRQTVSPGPHHAHSDQHASLRDNKSQQEGPLDQAEDSHSVSTDWSNLPDHLVESVLRNLQSGESAPLHPENKSAKLVRGNTPQQAHIASQCKRLPCYHVANEPCWCCSRYLRPRQCPGTGGTSAGGYSSKTYGIFREASDTLCNYLDW